MERYDPFEEMDRMFEQLRTRMWTPERRLGEGRRRGGGRRFGDQTRLGDDFGASRREAGLAHSEREMSRNEGVSIDLKRRDDGFAFVADLPGFEREDVTLSFEDGVLTLDAESETRDERTGGEGEIAIRGEFASTRRLSERVTIPEEVIEDDIDATFRNGVLEVHLPMADPEEGDDGGNRIDIGE